MTVIKDNEHNITKTGMYVTLGNKGFFTVTLQIFDKILSIGSGHLEAGQGKNKDFANLLNLKSTRIKELIYELIDERIIVEEGGNRNRVYRLNDDLRG